MWSVVRVVAAKLSIVSASMAMRPNISFQRTRYARH
jgi:hypothetical protein